MISKEQLQNIKNHYIIAKHRSGSTLLTLFLGNNSTTVSIHEENIYYKFRDKYDSKIFNNSKIIDEFLKDFYCYKTHRGVVNSLPDINSLKIDLSKYAAWQLNFKDFCNIFYQYFYSSIEKNKISTIINKDLIFQVSVEKIHNYSPESKFVFLIRDSAQSIQSSINIGYGSSNVIGQSYIWNNLMNDIISSYEKLPTENYLIIKFEDLIEDTTKTLINICNFLKIPFQEDMLDNVAAAKKYFDYTEQRKKERNEFVDKTKSKNIQVSIREKINKKKITEHNFSSRELKKIKFFTRRVRKKLNYNSEKIIWSYLFLPSLFDLYQYIKSAFYVNFLKFYHRSSYYQKVIYRKINVFNYQRKAYK